MLFIYFLLSLLPYFPLVSKWFTDLTGGILSRVGNDRGLEMSVSPILEFEFDIMISIITGIFSGISYLCQSLNKGMYQCKIVILIHLTPIQINFLENLSIKIKTHIPIEKYIPLKLFQ